MTRLLRFLLLLGAIGTLVAAVLGDRKPFDSLEARRGIPETFRSQAPPERFSGGPLLPPPTGRESIGMIDVDARKGNTQGSAASIDERGIWLTARHVVEGCEVVVVQDPRERWVRTRVAGLHPQSDLAILTTRGGTPAYPFSDETLRIGETAYGVGYPKDVPSTVEGSLLGRGRLGFRGRMIGEASVTVWVEKQRWPENENPLSGISGGPLFDRQGRIIGVVIAATVRRGRFFAASPENVQDMLAQLPDTDRPRRASPLGVAIGGEKARDFGTWSLTERMVTRVGCVAPKVTS
ncbi:MAG: serine protease [Alphaproteobacteria bacterium]